VIVAWADGQPIEADAVDAELRACYGGPGGHILPVPQTAEGRQLRRWVVQVLVVRALLAQEAQRRGLARSGPLPDADRATLGGITAAALAGSPFANAVFAAVTEAVTVADSAVDAYLAANPELAGEQIRLVLHVRAGRPVNGGRPFRMRRADLHGDLVFATEPGCVVAVGPDTLEVVDVLDMLVGSDPDIADQLLAAARARAFARWLDVALHDRVVLAPGSEHPADPAQPDHTHRH
jgi:[acyl-carrier-protein] S-malonyltransferase